MKCKSLLSIMTTLLSLILFTVVCYAIPLDNESNVSNSYGIASENSNAVNVTDYGAKDFVEPIECQLNGTNVIAVANGIGNLSVGDNIKIINGVGIRGTHKVKLTLTGLPSKPIKVFFSMYYSSSGTYDLDPANHTLKDIMDMLVSDSRLNQYWTITRIDDVTIEAESKAENDLTQKTATQLYGIAAKQPDETYDGTWSMEILRVGSPGVDLTAKITTIEENNIILDKKCGSTTTTKAYLDSTQAFKDAFNFANSNNYDVVIPDGNYYIDSDIYIQTNVRSTGKLYTSNKGTNSLFIISRKESPVKINGSSIAGSLEAGTRNIPELEQYADYDVIFDSQERIMWRNNGVGQFYSKREANRINSDGSLLVDLAESYNDKSLLTMNLYKTESPIRLEGLDILCIDNTITARGKNIIQVKRSDVTFDSLILDNENLSTKEGQNTGIGISDVVNIVINDSKIRGFMLDGYGYPVLVSRTLYVMLNNTAISEARHAVAGNADNYTIINGGSYEGYSGTLDSHWGHNYTVNNATVKGSIVYDGENFTINNCNITTESPTLIGRRMDCPTIKGNVEIKDTTVTYTGTSDFNFYRAELTDFRHDAEIYNPNLIIENVKLVLENDIPAVDIYAINHHLNAVYIMQKLPETIRVKDLYITGKDDAKLDNTHYRMMAATNMYYTGNPNIYLENIKINRNIQLDGSMNYDGEIAYSFLPNNTSIPDTHYNVEMKDCGTLSVNIVPTILGDMIIDNCIIVNYSYAGDLTNDWPNNPVWWAKGKGKTVFKNIKFDRTGLATSSISVMNDAEFENCEFINYGTIDYMDFGEQLPTVKILKVKDCIFNEGGITGGSLSEFMTPGTGGDEPGGDEPEDILFTVGDINFTDLDGAKITKLIGDTDIKASVAISSSTENVVPAAIILALYDENERIVSFSIVSIDIAGNTEATLATGFRLPQNIDGCKVKAFIWDSWENMKPLSNVVTFPLSK